MPNNTHKSAAVPFVNQKGERSMKRVKVERYVAGKKPAYANDDDEEEYYTTDDEQEDYDEEGGEIQEEGDNDDYYDDDPGPSRKLDHFEHESDDEESEDSNDNKLNTRTQNSEDKRINICDSKQNVSKEEEEEEDDDDDEDDPRFRRLKEIESRTDTRNLINIQRTQHVQSKYELSNQANVILDEDDDEEEIRQRHALARRRELEQPLGLQAVIGGDNQVATQDDDDDDESRQVAGKRLDTDDLLKDLKLSGISRPLREKLKTEEEEEIERQRLKEMIEKSRQEANFQLEIQKKVDEDIRREIEREALAKGDIGAREMTSVQTDDEDDDELAYEEWKLREIKRVLRDRSERQLASASARVR